MSDDGKTTSVYLQPDVAREADAPEVNVSGLINKLLRGYFDNESGHVALLELQEEQINDRIHTLEAELEQERERLGSVQEQIRKQTTGDNQ